MTHCRRPTPWFPWPGGTRRMHARATRESFQLSPSTVPSCGIGPRVFSAVRFSGFGTVIVPGCIHMGMTDVPSSDGSTRLPDERLGEQGQKVATGDQCRECGKSLGAGYLCDECDTVDGWEDV